MVSEKRSEIKKYVYTFVIFLNDLISTKANFTFDYIFLII